MQNSNTNSMSRIGQNNMIILNMKDQANSFDSSTNFADAYTETGRDGGHSGTPLPYRIAAYRD